MMRVLRAIGPFRYLPSSRLAPLAEHGRLTTFEPGADLVRQDEVADRIYVIASGQVRVGQSNPHFTEPLILAELGPGEVIGEMGVLSGRPCSATVTAVQPTEALELAAAELPETLRLVPEVSDILIRILGRRLRRTDDRIDWETKGVAPAIDSVADSVEEGICQVDLVGRVTFANLPAARLTGYKIPELLGGDLHALVHPARGGDGCASPACQVYADLQQNAQLEGVSEPSEGLWPEDAPEEREDVFWRRDGSIFPVSYRVEPQDEDGEIVGITISFRVNSEQTADDQVHSADSGDPGTHAVGALPLAFGLGAR